MSEETILAVLEAHGTLPVQPKDALSLELLTGGFWNRVYRLRSKENASLDWVVKQFVQVPVNPMFPILPTAEHAALQFLQDQECAPTPIAFIADSPAGSLLVYEYVQGSIWNGDLEAAAILLARVQSIPIDAFAMDAFRKLPTDAIALQNHAQAMLQGHQSVLSDSVRELRPPVSTQPVHPHRRGVLVHTDCGPGNMVSSPQGLRLIDWQCPGIGDGLQDVVTFLSPAMQVLYGYPVLTAAQEQQFLGAYFAALDERPKDAQKTRARLHSVRSSHHYRFAAYCAMRAQDTATSDEKTSRLYGVALQAEIQILHRLLTQGLGP
ncbi:MAG: aminoglycoside phosphotransferase family protein [Rhodoferax sp.]|nr:aminoglycoside phosphotransferase family protein [Rhodoferax sp.]